MAANSSFKLPQGWYRKAVAEAIEHLEALIGPLTTENAWLFLYCCVVWQERYPKDSDNLYLHINDRLKTRAGQESARRAEAFLRSVLPEKADFGDVLDQIGRRYDAERRRQGVTTAWQRNNITGNALEATLQVLIQRLAGVLPSRTPNLNTLQGFELAPAGYHSRPDLALFSARDFRLLISTKWTLRKERIGTYLHEAYFYKQRRPDLQVAFVVAEFNANILRWLVNDPLVDRVYHVGLPMLLDVHAPWTRKTQDPREIIGALLRKSSQESREYATFLQLTEKIFPLEHLFSDVTALRATAEEFSPDPEIEDQRDEDLTDDSDSFCT